MWFSLVVLARRRVKKKRLNDKNSQKLILISLLNIYCQKILFITTV